MSRAPRLHTPCSLLALLALAQTLGSAPRSSVPPTWWRRGWPRPRVDSVAEAQLLSHLAVLLMPSTPIGELFRSFPSPPGWGGHYLEPDLTAYGVLKDPNAALFVEYDGYWRHGERDGMARDHIKSKALLAYGPPGSCVLRITHTHSSQLKDQVLLISVRNWYGKNRGSLHRTLTEVLKKTSLGLDQVLLPEVVECWGLQDTARLTRMSARADTFIQKAVALRTGNTTEEILHYLEAEGFSPKRTQEYR